MIKYLKKYYQKILIAGLMAWPGLVLAQGVNTGGAGVTNPIHAASFKVLLEDILTVLIDIGTPILVIAFVWVGFMFISARGNPTKIEEARKSLWHTLIGAAIVIGAWAITNIITNTVNSLK